MTIDVAIALKSFNRNVGVQSIVETLGCHHRRKAPTVVFHSEKVVLSTFIHTIFFIVLFSSSRALSSYIVTLHYACLH